MRLVPRIESLLSARQFMAPQLVAGRIYFVSDLSGRLSLYAMDALPQPGLGPGGGVPEPLLPPHLALQNPHLLGGAAFRVYPQLNRIVLMLDHDGDEKYQPMWIPITGGYPEPVFGEQLSEYRCYMSKPDVERNLAYFGAASLTEAMNITYRGHIGTGTLVELGRSTWGLGPDATSADHSRIALTEGFSFSDNVLWLWENGERRLLYGTPLEQRQPGQKYKTCVIGNGFFTAEEKGLLLVTSLFTDTYGLGYLELDKPGEVNKVKITGAKHSGLGELTGLDHLHDEVYQVTYNIDGCSWLYEGRFDPAALKMKLTRVLCGAGELAGGVLESSHYDKASDTHVLSFSTATTPPQIRTVGGKSRNKVAAHTRGRVLGLPAEWLAPGEDASFDSHDGLRISARLYRPAEALGFSGARPLVYYIHGGPQSQERPDFAWFSMPLIQFLTLNGFAVFVPNVRGSQGYGQKYMQKVDHDWGGQDRLDHVHALTQVLPNDSRIDVQRAGVVGRSYGGYMTLTLALRHPELWSAAVDMFGPYNLFTFVDRVPETWKPYFHHTVGHPERDKGFLTERSPSTYIENLRCPLLVIQGKNDPRVTEQESRDVVEQLRAKGKTVDYLVFENEGHDVLKYDNKVTCYNAITDFFKTHLDP
jgi:pimeloyl-ACP methyl ester carboxylesterase